MKNVEHQNHMKPDSIAEITAHARDDIIWVRGACKWASGIIGVIVALVHDQAKDRIDAMADVLIQTDVTNRIAPIRDELLILLLTNRDEERIRIQRIDEALSESRNAGTNLEGIMMDAKGALKRLDEQSDFFLTVLAAENDDRNAFDKLTGLAGNTDYRLHDTAEMARETISESYVGPFSERPYLGIQWRPDAKPNEYGMSEIELYWTNVPAQYSRGYLDFGVCSTICG